jgi:hypothetical protein
VKAAASSLHSNVEEATDEENPNVADVSGTVPEGPEVIDVSGPPLGAPARGRNAVSQPAHSRPELNVQVLGPLAPVVDWGASTSSWRLPPMSQAWVIPAGEAIVTVADEELIAMQPTIIALALAVLTPAMVADVLDGPVAVLAVVSRGVVVSAPEYRAMPAPFLTEPESVHL